jgi:hypothetical protein
MDSDASEFLPISKPLSGCFDLGPAALVDFSDVNMMLIK